MNRKLTLESQCGSLGYRHVRLCDLLLFNLESASYEYHEGLNRIHTASERASSHTPLIIGRVAAL